jgi:hypothetical protein
MQNNFLNKVQLKHVIILLILAIIGLVVFWKTFQLEIFGDEWEGIWWTTSTLQRTGHFNDRIDYKPYETAAILLNLVSGASSLNYNSTSVYLFSYFMRLLAVFSLYYFLLRRGLPVSVSFIGALLFLITPIGIQATDWAKNFTSYISIGFMLLCLNSILNLKFKRGVISFLITFSLAVYINPIRAHGVILLVISTLIYQLIFNKVINKKNILWSLVGSLVIIFIFTRMLIFWDKTQFQSSIIEKLGLIFSQTLNGDLTRVGDLFILMGRGLIPYPNLLYIFLLMMVLLLWKNYLFKKKYLLINLILNSVFFIVFLSLFSSPEGLTLFVGLYFSTFIITAFLIELFNKKIPEAFITILSLFLNLFFVLVPWILGYTDITESTHRYLIYSSLSIPIIAVFSLSQNHFKDLKKTFFIPLKLSSISFFVTVLFLIMFFLSLKSEINKMYRNHNQETAKVIWQQIIPHFNNIDFKNHTPIILFDSDNAAMLHGTVLFGMGYHMGYIYKIWDYDKLPIPLDNLETLKSMLTDGKASKRYTGKEIVFPKEDAFYFHIKDDKVTRIDISNLFKDSQ